MKRDLGLFGRDPGVEKIKVEIERVGRGCCLNGEDCVDVIK